MTSEKSSFASALRPMVVAALAGSVLFVGGCRSAFVRATIVNHSTQVRLVEVDYPSASFGTTNLDSGAEYHYRFKVQGSGTVKMDFVDAHGKAHHTVGPELDEGQEGTLVITIDDAGKVNWAPSLTVAK